MPSIFTARDPQTRTSSAGSATARTSSRRIVRTGVAVGVAVGVAASLAAVSQAAVIPGTDGPDVHFGLDNDNATNTFIQPPGVTAKQHMDNTDVVFGRAGDDLLVGNLGSDTIPAGKGHDILIGGPENFAPADNSDVLLGDEGNDINIWAPGDGSDAFVGDKGYDTMVFAPFLKNADGSLKLEWYNGRRVPRVDIDGQATTCSIVKVPANQNLGAQFLVRFNVGTNPVITVRQKDVEQVLCTTSAAGKVAVADLTVANPTFHDVWLDDIDGTLGAIVAAP